MENNEHDWIEDVLAQFGQDKAPTNMEDLPPEVRKVVDEITKVAQAAVGDSGLKIEPHIGVGSIEDLANEVLQGVSPEFVAQDLVSKIAAIAHEAMHHFPEMSADEAWETTFNRFESILWEGLKSELRPVFDAVAEKCRFKAEVVADFDELEVISEDEIVRPNLTDREVVDAVVEPQAESIAKAALEQLQALLSRQGITFSDEEE